jgi:Cytidylate kinase-like family
MIHSLASREPLKDWRCDEEIQLVKSGFSFDKCALDVALHTMIRVITIEREYGCGAAEIARGLSDRQGWKLWDQLLTQEIARLAHCQQSEVRQRVERLDPLYYRLFKSLCARELRGQPNTEAETLVDTVDDDHVPCTTPCSILLREMEL